MSHWYVPKWRPPPSRFWIVRYTCSSIPLKYLDLDWLHQHFMSITVYVTDSTWRGQGEVNYGSKLTIVCLLEIRRSQIYMCMSSLNIWSVRIRVIQTRVCCTFGQESTGLLKTFWSLLKLYCDGMCTLAQKCLQTWMSLMNKGKDLPWKCKTGNQYDCT